MSVVTATYIGGHSVSLDYCDSLQLLASASHLEWRSIHALCFLNNGDQPCQVANFLLLYCGFIAPRSARPATVTSAPCILQWAYEQRARQLWQRFRPEESRLRTPLLRLCTLFDCHPSCRIAECFLSSYGSLGTWLCCLQHQASHACPMLGEARLFL